MDSVDDDPRGARDTLANRTLAPFNWGTGDLPVEALRLALLLTVVVVCVVVATRPEPHRRRTVRTTNRRRVRNASDSAGSHRASDSSRTPLYRNRWDRSDIARAVGRDFAEPESTLRWPSGTLTPRV